MWRMVELSDVVDNATSNLLPHVSGTLRLASPPNISDTLLAPVVGVFQEAYPEVRVHIFITDRIIDHVSEGVEGSRLYNPAQEIPKSHH